MRDLVVLTMAALVVAWVARNAWLDDARREAVADDAVWHWGRTVLMNRRSEAKR